MDGLIDGKYRYFAFICYTHADYKEAERLYNKLQHYALPNRLMKNEGCVKHLVPVFWDYRDLYGAYREADQKALKESKFLIVVCSHNLNSHDTEVNQEIKDFLDAGNTIDKVIPFIVDVDEASEQNCFPRKLAQLCKESNVIGHSVFDHEGKKNYRAALLKTVARMQDLSVSELENEDQRRRKKSFKFRVLAVVVLLVLFMATYLFLVTTRFNSILNLTVRFEGTKEWKEELYDVKNGDIIQFQIEFVNSRGPLSNLIYKFTQNNDVSTSTSNIMIYSRLPEGLEYIMGSTLLYDSIYQEGVMIADDTLTIDGINIGNYAINANGYVRFSCRVNNDGLVENGILTVWATSTINQTVEKDSVTLWAP